MIRGISGSGPLGVVAHIAWLGQPAQASPLPARLDSGPGQCSVLRVSDMQGPERSVVTNLAPAQRVWVRS